jgi:glycosyltransferase A (GT-A) superfamily protein (DUF2064 family)
MNHHNALIVFDDADVPASCPAPAVPPLSPGRTRALRRACFLDMIHRYAEFPTAAALAYASSDELLADVQRELPGVAAFRQEGATAAERVVNAVGDTFDAGFRHVLLLFSSALWLHPRVVENGCALLDTHEDVLVIAPTVRGSYALIGMRYPQDDVLRLIDSQPARLYEETMRALSARDTALFVLTTIPDIVTADDLERLWLEEFENADPAQLPRTRELLAGLHPPSPDGNL